MVIFLLVLFVAERSYSQEVIVWDSATKLTWTDFWGKVDAKSPFDAASTSGMRYQLKATNEGFSDSVVAVFYPGESWVRRPTESGLIHEQGHFDITEIFARRLRKRLQEFVPKRGDLPHQLNLLYNETENERDAMEKLYDRETKHSVDSFRQARWNARIRNELKELEEFAN
jgi:hypothetical protein